MKNSEFIILEKQLDDLFKRWRDTQEKEKDWHDTTVWEEIITSKKTFSGIEKNSFVRDGIISDKYDHKVLFILKEANILRHRKDEKNEPNQRSQIEWYQDFVKTGEKDNSSKQLEKIGRMYCFLGNNNESPSNSEIRDGVNHIAFMNLNKRGGDNNEKIISAYIEKRDYRNLIIEQIDLLNPEYIICLGSYHWIEKIAPKIGERYKVKNIWHTAYTRSKQLGYIGIDRYMTEFIKRINL